MDAVGLISQTFTVSFHTHFQSIFVFISLCFVYALHVTFNSECNEISVPLVDAEDSSSVTYGVVLKHQGSFGFMLVF